MVHARRDPTGQRRWIETSNWWFDDTRDALMMGVPDPDIKAHYPEQSPWNTVREALATSGYTRTVSGTVADALERVRNSRNGMGHRDVPAVEPERLRDAREKIQRAQERIRELTIMLEEM
jgi:hypothetical protein